MGVAFQRRSKVFLFPMPFSFFLRVVPVCLLAAVLTGCIGGTVDPEHQAAAKRIGVVSVLGDQAQGHTAGVPAILFPPRSQRAEAGSDLDAAASAHAVNRLRASHPVSAVVDLQAERGSVRLHVPTGAGLFNTGEFQTFNKDLTDAAHQLATRHALNLVVMIVPSVGTNSGAGQPPNNPGYGVWSLSLFGAHLTDATVFANFAVEAFDGSTGQRLSFKIASVHTIVDDVSPRASLDAYPPAERAKLDAALREIVLKALDEQLAHMHLTPD